MSATDSFPRPLIILGTGYAGRFIYDQAKAQGRQVYCTSRSPEAHLTFVPPQQRIEFDLLKEQTWQHIPENADLFWCFPPLPQTHATNFAKLVTERGARILVLGSTSAYPAKEGSIIDETVKPDCSLPRVKCEEFLRATLGVIILRLAGIYGPGRNVVNWIRRGKLSNSSRFINLIHVEDVAGICLAALERSQPAEVYILSDGRPRPCSEICQMAAQRWGLHASPSVQPENLGKRLRPNKIFTGLHYTLRHPDLYKALDLLESFHVGI